jgi:outer membrane protein assembly factor BamB
MTLALLLLLQTDAPWPQWLGANRDNRSTETGLLDKWPAAGPKRVWASSAVGTGFGAVSVAGGKVFLLGDLEDASYLLALNEKDGKTAWKLKVGPARNHANKDWQGPRSTPTVDGDRVYAMGEAGDLVCAEAASGKEVWRKNMAKDLGGEAPKWLYCDSPLIDGSHVIVKPGGSQGAVAALDKATGAAAWRSQGFNDPVEHTSLMPAEIGGAKQYIVFTMKSVAGIGADGKLLWRADRPGDVAICTTPLYKDGIVLVGSSYTTGRTSAFQVSGGKAEKLYDADLANHHGGMVIVGDHVYGTGDRKKGTDRKNADLKCMELKTGKIVWENESVGKGSITFADGHLIVRSENPKTGGIALVEATPSGYKEKGRFALPDQTGRNSWAYPVVANGHLYIRNNEGLYSFNLKAK